MDPGTYAGTDPGTAADYLMKRGLATTGFINMGTIQFLAVYIVEEMACHLTQTATTPTQIKQQRCLLESQRVWKLVKAGTFRAAINL